MKFTDFDFNPSLLEAISYMGFEETTAIQEKSIPEILNKKDIIACAQTGTGKTAAFVLPTLNHLSSEENVAGLKALIIVPTRELAIQIDQQIQGFAYFVNLNCVTIYGGGNGTEWGVEKGALQGGANIVVATPGKLIAHLKMGDLKLDTITHLILDEADKMLDMGFMPDILKIVSHIPKQRQTIMFSATMPPKIRHLAKELLNNPAEVSIELSKPAEGVLQVVYLAYNQQKTSLIHSLLSDKPDYESILIFTSTKSKVTDIVRELKLKKYQVEAISSDLEQTERNNVLQRFKSKQTRILVGTDVISRGIDIKDISLVINYDVPGDAEDYVHRVGRTARANKTGVAITLVNDTDMQRFQRIEQLIDAEIIKLPVPESLGESPEWNVNKRSGGGFKEKRNYKGKGNRKPQNGRIKKQ